MENFKGETMTEGERYDILAIFILALVMTDFSNSEVETVLSDELCSPEQTEE